MTIVPEWYFPAAGHNLALMSLEYAIKEGGGLVVVTGDVGSGKTTLVHRILAQNNEFLETGVLINTTLSPRELLTSILREFDIQVPSFDNKALMLDALFQFLLQKYQQNIRVLLIIDEAHSLSQEAMEEVRMLSNLQSDRAALLQIVLVGHSSLKETLRRQALPQFAQRIRVSYHLPPLNIEETKKYISYRLDKAGAENIWVFSPEAMDSIYKYSGGIPRSINILCDAALVYGYADECREIGPKLVDEAFKDKQEFGILQGNEPEMLHDSTNSQAVESHGLRLEESEMLARIYGLEQQLREFSLKQNWLLQQCEDRAVHHQEDVVRKLEYMLREERQRSEQMFIRCQQLESELQKTCV